MQKNVNEETANSISHALGVVFGFVAIPPLADSMPKTLYGACFIFLFASSMLYHAVTKLKTKKWLQKVDHVSIYFMIAGSYTPFVFLCLEREQAWLFFSILWTIVLVGSVFKLFFAGRFERLSLILYLGMGWMVVFIAKPFLIAFDVHTILFVALGGVFYTGGVYFYVNDQRRYYHLIWHVFVLAGALCHFWAIASL